MTIELLEGEEVKAAPGDPVSAIGEVLQHSNPVDRILWRRAMERRLSRENSPLIRDLPKSGPRATALAVAGIFWAAIFIPVAMGDALLFAFVPEHSAARALAYVFAAVAGLIMANGLYHSIGAVFANSKYQQSER